MNSAPMNGAAINAGITDSTVRIVVVAAAYAIGQAWPRVLRRSATDVQVKAVIEARVLGVKTAPVVVQALAVGDVLGRAVIRAVSAVHAQAQLLVLRPAVRTMLALTTLAVIDTFSRAAVRATVGVSGLVGLTATGRAARRQSHSVTAQADVSGYLRVAVRYGVQLEARADAAIDARVVKRVQFDEPAVEAQTFIVAFTGNVFYVR